MSSLSSIDFSSIDSEFNNGIAAPLVNRLLFGIGTALTAVSNAQQDTDRLAQGLIELLRAFTSGNGQSSSSSSNDELINKYSSFLKSNQFNSSKSKKNVTLGLFQSIKETIIKSRIMKPIFKTLINFKF